MGIRMYGCACMMCACDCRNRSAGSFFGCFSIKMSYKKTFFKHKSIAREEMGKVWSGIKKIMLILQYPHEMCPQNCTCWCGQSLITGAAPICSSFRVLHACNRWWTDGMWRGCVRVCDSVSDCLRVFPAGHPNRSNCLNHSPTPSVLLSLLHHLFLFFITIQVRDRSLFFSFHLREIVAILL